MSECPDEVLNAILASSKTGIPATVEYSDTNNHALDALCDSCDVVDNKWCYSARGEHDGLTFVWSVFCGVVSPKELL